MLNIDLNRLRIFKAVFESGAVTKAALQLHVTPSAVSQALSLLEDEIGAKLFHRIGRSLQPTEGARRLHGTMKGFEGELRGALDGLKSGRVTDDGKISGELRIGAPPEFGSRQVVQWISKFSSRHPHAKFSIKYALPDRLIGMLLNDDIDIAFCDDGPYLKQHARVVAARKVFEERASLYCSKEFYKKFVGKDHSYRHLITLPHVDYRDDFRVLALWYQHHFKKVPTELDLRMNAENVNAMISAATAGMGLAFIPEHLVQNEVREGKLVKLEMSRAPYVNPILLIQLKSKVPSALERAFTKEILSK